MDYSKYLKEGLVASLKEFKDATEDEKEREAEGGKLAAEMKSWIEVLNDNTTFEEINNGIRKYATVQQYIDLLERNKDKLEGDEAKYLEDYSKMVSKLQDANRAIALKKESDPKKLVVMIKGEQPQETETTEGSTEDTTTVAKEGIAKLKPLIAQLKVGPADKAIFDQMIEVLKSCKDASKMNAIADAQTNLTAIAAQGNISEDDITRVKDLLKNVYGDELLASDSDTVETPKEDTEETQTAENEILGGEELPPNEGDILKELARKALASSSTVDYTALNSKIEELNNGPSPKRSMIINTLEEVFEENDTFNNYRDVIGTDKESEEFKAAATAFMTIPFIKAINTDASLAATKDIVNGVLQIKENIDDNGLAALFEKYGKGSEIDQAINDTRLIEWDNKRFDGKSVQFIWTQGWKDLEKLNRRLNDVNKVVKQAGYGPDAVKICGTIGKIVGSIGAAGMFIGNFLPPPNNVLVVGISKVLSGLGTSLGTGPAAVKAFNNGNIVKGLGLTLACLGGAALAASGVKDTANGIQANILADAYKNTDTKIADVKAALEKNPDDPRLKSKLESLEALKTAKESGTLSQEKFDALMKDPSKIKEVTDQAKAEYAGIQKKEADMAAKKAEEAEQLAIEDKYDATEEFKKTHGGYTEKQLNDYVKDHSKEGGWYKGNEGDPQAEAARAYMNSRPDVKAQTDAIMKSQAAYNTTKAEFDKVNEQLASAKQAVADTNTIAGGWGDPAHLSNAETAEFSKYFGDGTTTGWLNKSAKLDSTKLADEFIKIRSGNYDANDPQTKAALLAFSDATNHPNSKFAGLLHNANAFYDKQQALNTAKSSLDTSRATLSGLVRDETKLFDINPVTNALQEVHDKATAAAAASPTIGPEVTI